MEEILDMAGPMTGRMRHKRWIQERMLMQGKRDYDFPNSENIDELIKELYEKQKAVTAKQLSNNTDGRNQIAEANLLLLNTF